MSDLNTLLDNIAKTAKKLSEMDFEVSYRVRKVCGGLFGYPRKGFKDPNLIFFSEPKDEWFPSKYNKLVKEQLENVEKLQAYGNRME